MIIHEGRRTVPWDFFILVAVLLTMFVTGVVWTARYSAQSAEATGDGRFTVPVMAVQLNLSQKEKWDPANRRSIYRALLDMTEQGNAGSSKPRSGTGGQRRRGSLPGYAGLGNLAGKFLSHFPRFYRDATGERFSTRTMSTF